MWSHRNHRFDYLCYSARWQKERFDEMKRKKIIFHDEKKDKSPRHAHCSFCGGKGADMRAETVIDPLGKKYRVPVTHSSCKRSILSLSLWRLM